MSSEFYTFVSGASGGIGKAFCREFAKSGDNLIITARSDEKLNTLKKELQELNGEIDIITISCDLTDQSSRNIMFDKIISNGYVIDKLINVAGVDTQMPFEKYSQEKLTFQCRVVYESVVSLTLFALRQKKNGLKILTISSLCGTLPIPYFAVYSSLKSALISFFDALRFEYKSDKNVIITTVLPGSVPTRDDIIKDIEKQGMTGRLSKKPPEYIAQKSIKALQKKKKNFVPGFYNQLINRIQKITPKPLKIKVISQKFKNKEKDAF